MAYQRFKIPELFSGPAEVAETCGRLAPAIARFHATSATSARGEPENEIRAPVSLESAAPSCREDLRAHGGRSASGVGIGGRSPSKAGAMAG